MRRTASILAIAISFAAMAAQAQDKPQCRVGLPVRSLACINYPGHIVAQDAAKGQWQVQCDSDKEKSWVSSASLRNNCTAPDVTLSPASFAGRYEMFTGGGGAYFKQANGDWKMGSLNVAKTPPLVINADGTYVWTDFKTTWRGRWRVLSQAEFKYASQKPPIIQLGNAMDGKDWLVTRIEPASDGRDRIELERRDLGLTYRGTKMK